MNSNSWDNTENWAANVSNSNDKPSTSFLKKKRYEDDQFSFKKPTREEAKGTEEENPESNELFLRGLPYSADEDQLKEYFSKLGKVRFVKILKKEDGTSKGLGFVTFFNVEDARNALNESENLKIEGRSIKMSFSRGKGNSNGPKRDFPPRNNDQGKDKFGRKEENSVPTSSPDTAAKVFVAGVSFKASENDICNFFTKFGNVTEFKMLMNDEGKPKGCCFVGFDSEESAENAIGANGQDFKGRNIKVEMAKGGNSGSGRGGRGGRGGDRGGRGSDRGSRGGRGRGGRMN